MLDSLSSDLSEALQWRYAVKKMDPTKPVGDDKIAAILEAIQYAPTSSGTQPFKVFDLRNDELRAKLESIRLKAGRMMNLGDVSEKTVPKMTMVSAPQSGGAIATRTFIPHRCHQTIGVLGAVSVATACLLDGTPAYALANRGSGQNRNLKIEHPTGEMTVVATLEGDVVASAAILRTARKLMDGYVFTGED
mgnify:CR=1 FL=1